MEYYGKVPGQDGRMSKITKLGVVLLAIYMGVRGVQAGLWYYIPFALALIVFASFRREHVISGLGVDVCRVFLFYKAHSVWLWKEVTSILADYEVMKPSAMLLISRDSKTRQFIMDPEDAKAAVKLAKKHNPDIVVETRDASGRHKEYQYNRSTRKERKAADAAPVQVEDFKTMKEELRRQKQREEQLKQYRRPDPRTARKRRPEKKLRGFH